MEPSHAPPTSTPLGPGPRCLSCGYSLVGLKVDDACPECGQPVWRAVSPSAGNGTAVASLVLGIVALVMCNAYGVPALVCGPIAVYLGNKAKRRIADGTAPPNSAGMAKAGVVCGWIATALGALFVGTIFTAIALGAFR